MPRSGTTNKAPGHITLKARSFRRIWHHSLNQLLPLCDEQKADAGTILLSAVPAILGFQLLLHAIVLDIGNVPE